MVTRLHQVIVRERGITEDAKKRMTEIKHVLSVGGDRDPLTGLSRTFEKRLDDTVQLPPEYRKVQMTVTELIGLAQEQLVRLFDVKFTREAANTEARADVVLDGQVLLPDVPAGYLLFLETQVSTLIAEFIDKLPTLDLAQDWRDDDPALAAGVWASAPRETEHTRKIPQVQVLYAATKEHAAQVRPYETDVIDGYWTLIRYSGQLPVRTVQAIRARAVKILEAIRFAREEANTLEVTERKAGQAVLGYIFEPQG